MGLMLCCPMTTKIKGFPFEVQIAGRVASVVLADQVKNIDWRGRKATHKGKVSTTELEMIRAKVRLLVG